jgi:hypothetical protein
MSKKETNRGFSMSHLRQLNVPEMIHCHEALRLQGRFISKIFRKKQDLVHVLQSLTATVQSPSERQISSVEFEGQPI